MASIYSTSSHKPSISSSSSISKHASADLSGSVYLIDGNGRMLNLPIPSTSPRDPLNWTVFKRARAFFAMIFYAIVGLTIVQAPSLLFGGLAKEFKPQDTAPFEIVHLISAPTFFMGLGAFIWIPLSVAVGRRPVFLLCTIVTLLTTLWAGLAGSFYQLLIAVSFLGLAEGMSTSLVLHMVIDLTFIHQRPLFIAMMWSLVGFFNLTIMSFIPQMTTGLHWRPFYYLWTIPSLFSVLFAFFFFPETYYMRPAVAFNGHVLVQSSTEKICIYEDWEEVPGGKLLPETPPISKLGGFTRQLRFWGTTRGGWRAMLSCYPQILLCFLNPLIFWVTVLQAIVFASMLSIGETYAMVLSAPPYNLSMKTTAFVNLAGGFGALLALPLAALSISWVSKRLAMSNNGVKDAEHYLPAFILPITTGAASSVLYGLTLHFHLSAFLVYFSYFLNSFAFVTLATASTLWVTEAFPRWAAAALVNVFGLGYMASFAISFAIRPWVEKQGYLAVNLEIAGAILLVGGVVVPVAFWGKRFRGVLEGRWSHWGVWEAGALRPR
ncbi:major facilitator superfamily transporter [Halenospora varia]|nr:major facilitator superfamily transporter [Halenospora varia]